MGSTITKFRTRFNNHKSRLNARKRLTTENKAKDDCGIYSIDYQGKRVNPLYRSSNIKLFLDIVPSSSVEITLALRGCFGEGSVYMSFRLVSFQSKQSKTGKPPTLWDVVFEILVTSKGASALGMF